MLLRETTDRLSSKILVHRRAVVVDRAPELSRGGQADVDGRLLTNHQGCWTPTARLSGCQRAVPETHKPPTNSEAMRPASWSTCAATARRCQGAQPRSTSQSLRRSDEQTHTAA